MLINTDLTHLRKIIASNPNLHAFEKFGEIGSTKLSFLMDKLRTFYQNYPAENLSFDLTFFIKVNADQDKEQDVNSILPEYRKKISSLDDVHIHISSLSQKSVLFQVYDDGTCEISYTDNYPVLVKEIIGKNYIVYCFTDNKETFYIGDHVDEMIPFSPLFPSNFCSPTYHSLNDALQNYYIKMARESSCKILQNIWHGGLTGPRLVLNNKPERIMRNSLLQALVITLTDADVRPEQNTDESKPVDIKVTWLHSKATALIEIKWIGSSLILSPKNPSKPFTTYDDSRAHDGAQQLLNYIDNEYTSSPDRIPQAYLVVFDARRNNIKGPDDKISLADAFHYESKEIVYDEKYSELGYYSAPYRFYLRPRVSSL